MEFCQKILYVFLSHCYFLGLPYARCHDIRSHDVIVFPSFKKIYHVYNYLEIQVHQGQRF